MFVVLVWGADGQRYRAKEKRFEKKADAARYANDLLRQGYRARIRPAGLYRYVDRLASQGPPGGLKVEEE